MRGTEMRAIGDLAGRTLAGAGTMVRDLHMAVAGRAFTAVGPGGAPVRLVHDGVVETLYGGVRAALEALPRGAGSAAARSAHDEGPALGQSPRGSLALAALNAYIGDALVAGDSPLALAMTLRHRGAELSLEPQALAHALPDAGPRLAIFVHGLGETDASWRLRADAQRPGYGAGLRRDLGHTPLELRCNTGLHISDNGRALAALLEELHEAWPVAVEEIVIVGHSMGGLVARSACHYAGLEAHAWTSALRHVFCLGSPHLGAPLRRASTRCAGRWAVCPRRARWPTCWACAAPGSRTCATGRASRRTGATAIPTSCSPTAAMTSPSCPARASTSSLRRSAGVPATRSPPSWETSSSVSPAPRARAAGARSASRSRTATTSAA
jgi:pimeloyl-ACP methyl ester carboxylesterase